MRLAEIVTAGLLALLSLYMMWKSTALNVGFIKGEGPGGGFWPFWLSAIMFVCTILIAVNWVRRSSPPSQSEEEFLDSYGMKMLGLVGGGLLGFVALIDVISMYGAMILFLFYYLRILGKHSWLLTLLVSFGVPILFFFFFEGLMQITMPKGYSFTDPVYDVLYDIIY